MPRKFHLNTALAIAKVILGIIVPFGLTVWCSIIVSKTPAQRTTSEIAVFAVFVVIWIAAFLYIIIFDKRLKQAIISRTVSGYEKGLKEAKIQKERILRASNSVEELASYIIHRIPVETLVGQDPINKLQKTFDIDDLMNGLITQLYFFYKNDPQNEDEQEYRVIFLKPKNDSELEVKCFQSTNGEEPIILKRGITIKKDNSSCAGWVWSTMQPHKIEDVDLYCLERTGADCHFKQLHEEKSKEIKSIFCIPVYDEPEPEEHFYGVLCIDTNKKGRFKTISNKKDYQLAIIKPFLKRICAFYRLKKQLNS